MAGGLAFAAVVAMVYAVLARSPGLLDWDTYARLLFIGELRIEHVADGHLLLHVVLHALVRLGLTPAQAVFSSTAVGVGLLLASGAYVARERGLEGRSLALVVVALWAASPGIVAMTLMAEDNVAYLAPLLLFFHWLTAPSSGGEDGVAGAKAGVMLAIAMLLNVTALVLLFLLPLAPALWLLRRRGEAVRLGTAAATALGVYYAAHLVLFTGAPIAMHEFLPQALRLRDFEQSTTPLWSGARLVEYVGGFRAMALTPVLHMMAPPYWLVPIATRWAPGALLAIYGIIVARAWWRGRGGPIAGWWKWLLPGSTVAIGLAFPFFYEPALIERWDMFWLLLFLGLVAVVRSRPRAGEEVVLAFGLALQVAGSCLVVAHQLGRAYERPSETELREDLAVLERVGADPIVLPLTVDRLFVALLANRLPGRRIYLVGEEGGQRACRQMASFLRELPVSCVVMTGNVGAAHEAYVDWRAAPYVSSDQRPPK